MNFYNLDELKFDNKSIQSIKADGIPIELMSEIFLQLSKTKDFQTTESISGLQICYYSHENSIQEGKPVVVSGEVKKRQKKTKYSFVEKNSIFEFQDANQNQLFMIISGETLHASKDKTLIEALIANKAKKQFPTVSHKAAYSWLENGEVGMSSLSLCAAMFADLDHEVLNRHSKKEKVSYPYDMDDFGRCYKFIQAIPDGKERLKTVSLGTEWSNIISNWSSIESGYLSQSPEDKKAAYNLLQRCIGRNKQIKP